MTGRNDDIGATFGDRVNYLIRTHPDRPTDAEICKGIEQQGGHLSATQLGKIRKGMGNNPTLATAHQLAAYFGVEQSFLTDFSNPEAAVRTVDERALQILQRAGVKDVLFRMGSMSPAALDVLSTVSKQLVELNQEHAPKTEK